MTKHVDICLFLEGTYPYVSGGVSTWVHELIQSQDHLSFHIIAILAPNSDTTLRYEMPKNVVGIDHVFLQDFQKGDSLKKVEMESLFTDLETPLMNLQTHANIKHLQSIINAISKTDKLLGKKVLMDSKEAWSMILRMYNSSMGNTSFLDYFWSWRALLGGLYSVLLGKLPEADVYHALCTGYAGLYLARASIETGKPCILTEHGIYTNERRIEIASADWLDDRTALNLNVTKNLTERNLRDFWVDTFTGYSQICYDVCTYIITLYEGNKSIQILDGADSDKLLVIPNGIDYERYSQIEKDTDHQPTIALIGRVVPIKDIKTFIRSCNILSKSIPDLKALILGPMYEDEEYYNECVDMVMHDNLQDIITFTGKVNINDYLGKIDIIVLSSISEAQPLVILEAGAAGIPSVATDVGACREMIFGRIDENPKLGEGGGISHLSNPQEMAKEINKLLSDKQHYNACSQATKQRVHKYYNKNELHKTYHNLYKELML